MNQNKLKVVTSNGSYKFHLAPLSVELENAGLLAGFLTAGWPSGWLQWLARRFPESRAWKRLLDRYEPISPEKIYSIGLTEVFFKFGDIFLRSVSQKAQQHCHRRGFWLYQRVAMTVLKKLKPHIYHYRNCYGGPSVELAKRMSVFSLCDHSIAEPVCAQWMVDHRGSWPSNEERAEQTKKLTPLGQAMLADLRQADAILVNSDFVKETLTRADFDPKRVFVVYWGVDNKFLAELPTPDIIETRDRSQLLFAGGWQKRKGVLTLIDALDLVQENWQLKIAAGADPEMSTNPRVQSFFNDQRVTLHGVLPRKDLASLMSKHRIFVFPSYCEGSARVVFEAMAAGCYIITTPNTGSIVVDNIHGRVVPPGNSTELAKAIEYALTHSLEVEKIGKSNAELIAREYRQSDYARKVIQVYEQILSA